MSKITCTINDDLTIALADIRKIEGNDGNMPFQADIYLKSEKQGLPKLTCVGRIANDGWGTTVRSAGCAQYFSFLDEIDEQLKQNYQIQITKSNIEWGLDYLLSIMAECSIERHQTHMNIMDMNLIVTKLAVVTI